jgi:hypothetical protein
MALRAHLVANPTPADVTVNAKIAVAGAVTQLNIEDTSASGVDEAAQFTAAGCAVQRADVLDVSERQEAAFLLSRHRP